jgi:hypothetical protein
MIEILGPQYRYQGEQLNQPEIIVVRDHHYNEQDCKFHIKTLLENSSCDPAQHVVIFDHVLAHDDVLKDYNLIYFPSFMARENTEFLVQNIQPNWHNKTHTFNFMINKPRPHREILLQLVEGFQLDNYTHSLAWRSNPVNSIAVTNYLLGTETVMDQGVKSGPIRNAKTYQTLLQTRVFEPTCVSLITEPAFYERETIVTEKTLMAMWAGTIPVWIGGWRIADWMKNQGFDVFDDIIDHSYQDLYDPGDRCCQALENNLSILQNFDKVHNFIRSNQTRFDHNLRLLESNFFNKKCAEIIQQQCPDTQAILGKILQQQISNSFDSADESK